MTAVWDWVFIQEVPYDEWKDDFVWERATQDPSEAWLKTQRGQQKKEFFKALLIQKYERWQQKTAEQARQKARAARRSPTSRI